ncbi:MAG TPA: PspC domain-containing protein [Actinomycetota bacterium]|nr:PspC domain-containing protein [Actinomycetota bacterium]
MNEPGSSTATPHVLRRSRHDRMIAGVCGGLGRYLGVDPILLRIAFVVLAIAGGSGILIYIVAIIVIPEERPGEELGAVHAKTGATGRILVGTALIAFGTILLIDRFISWFDKVIGPLTLVALGVAILVWGTRR